MAIRRLFLLLMKGNSAFLIGRVPKEQEVKKIIMLVSHTAGSLKGAKDKIKRPEPSTKKSGFLISIFNNFHLLLYDDWLAMFLEVLINECSTGKTNPYQPMDFCLSLMWAETYT